jgi:hypothetical protein
MKGTRDREAGQLKSRCHAESATAPLVKSSILEGFEVDVNRVFDAARWQPPA